MDKLDVAASLVLVAKRVTGGACGDETSKYYDRAHPDLAIGALHRNISTCSKVGKRRGRRADEQESQQGRERARGSSKQQQAAATKRCSPLRSRRS